MSAIQTWRMPSANERLSLCTYANEWQPCVNGIVVLGLSFRYSTRLQGWDASVIFAFYIDNVVPFLN